MSDEWGLPSTASCVGCLIGLVLLGAGIGALVCWMVMR